MYQLLHAGGACGGAADGTNPWISDGSLDGADLPACATHCRERLECAYFSHNPTTQQCSLYTAAGGCPTATAYPGYSSYTFNASSRAWPIRILGWSCGNYSGPLDFDQHGGDTADGRPWFARTIPPSVQPEHTTGTTLYYDADCNGDGKEGGNVPMWYVHSNVNINENATSDIDGNADCWFSARSEIQTTAATLPSQSDIRFFCNGDWPLASWTAYTPKRFEPCETCTSRGLDCGPTAGTCIVSEAVFADPVAAFGANITVLDWADVNVVGEIPDLSGLINLEVVNLKNNPGLAPGPIWPWLAKLKKLKELRIGNSNRNGDLTNFDFSVWKDTLEVLEVNANPFEQGALPPSIATLTKLVAFYVQHTQRDGDLDAFDFGSALPSTIKSLWLDGNPLFAAGAIIPAQIKTMSSLTELSLGNTNRQGNLTGTDFTLFPDMEVLFFSVCHGCSAGPLPPSLFKLANLRELHFSNVNLNGHLALHDFSVWKETLEVLGLDSNPGLTRGPIPPSIATLTKLRYLNFRNTNRDGDLAAFDFAPFSKTLRELWLADNPNFTRGPVPESIKTLSMLSAGAFTLANTSRVGAADPTACGLKMAVDPDGYTCECATEQPLDSIPVLELIGQGFCRSDYRGGNNSPGTTIDACKASCIADLSCNFISFIDGLTCSRYSGERSDCTPLAAGKHQTYALSIVPLDSIQPGLLVADSRPDECWFTCGGNGPCSQCNGKLGALGACCQKGIPTNSPECKRVPVTTYKHPEYHECVLLPETNRNPGYTGARCEHVVVPDRFAKSVPVSVDGWDCANVNTTINVCGNGEYTRGGSTRDGRPWYSRTDPETQQVCTLFYDAKCNDKNVNAWFITSGTIEISSTAGEDVDGDGTCQYVAKTSDQTASAVPPTGDWQVSCNASAGDSSSSTSNVMEWLTMTLSFTPSVCNECSANKLDCGPAGRSCVVPADPVVAFGGEATVLDLSGMQLSGTLPDLSAMTNLKVLNVSNNPGLDAGPLWPWLARMTALTELWVGNTNRNGDGGINLSLSANLEVLDFDSSCNQQWLAQTPDRGPVDVAGTFINRARFVGRAADAYRLVSQDPLAFAYAVLGADLYVYTTDFSFAAPVYQTAGRKEDGSVGSPGGTEIAEWSYTEPGLQGFERGVARCTAANNTRFGFDGDAADASIDLVSPTAKRFEYGAAVADWSECLALCSTTAACQQVVYDASASACYGMNKRGNGKDSNAGNSTGFVSATCTNEATNASKLCRYSEFSFKSGPLWPWLANLTKLRELQISSANRIGHIDPAACGLAMSQNVTEEGAACACEEGFGGPNCGTILNLLECDAAASTCTVSQAAIVAPAMASSGDTTMLVWEDKNIIGEIPDLSGLINLEVVNLKNNPGLAPGPIWPWLSKLTKLKELRIGNSNRNGDLTNFDFSVWKDTLEVLDVSSNPFAQGALPPSIATLTSLTHFYAQDTQRDGDLDAFDFGSALPSTIKSLWLDGNPLFAAGAIIPAQIKTMLNLTELSLGNTNRQGDLAGTDFTVFPGLEVFEFSDCSGCSAGPIPPSLFKLTQLRELHFFNVNFNGDLAMHDFSVWENTLEVLNLDNNPGLMRGPIPPSIATLTKLRYLNFRNTNRDGDLAAFDFAPFSKTLRELWLADNPNFTRGPVPESIKTLSMLSAGAFSLANTNRVGAADPTACGLKMVGAPNKYACTCSPRYIGQRCTTPQYCITGANTEVTDHTSVVNVVAFSPDGKRLASGRSDGTIIITDVATGNTMNTLVHSLGAGNVKGLGWAQNNAFLASSGAFSNSDWGVILWNPITWTKIQTRDLSATGFYMHEKSLSVSTNGAFITGIMPRSESGDHKGVSVLSSDTLQEISTFRPTVEFSPYATAISFDNKLVVVGGRQLKSPYAAYGFDPLTGKELVRFIGAADYDMGVQCVAISKDKSWVLTAGGFGTVTRWAYPGGNKLQTYNDPDAMKHIKDDRYPDHYVSHATTSMALANFDTILATSGFDYENSAISIFNVATGEVIKQVPAGEHVMSLAFFYDHTLLAFASAKEVTTYDGQGTNHVTYVRTDNSRITCVGRLISLPNGAACSASKPFECLSYVCTGGKCCKGQATGCTSCNSDGDCTSCEDSFYHNEGGCISTTTTVTATTVTATTTTTTTVTSTTTTATTTTTTTPLCNGVADAPLCNEALTAQLGGCWNADVQNLPICNWQDSKDEFVCQTKFCSVQSPSSDPSACATKAPDGYVANPDTGKCEPANPMTADFRCGGKFNGFVVAELCPIMCNLCTTSTVTTVTTTTITKTLTITTTTTTTTVTTTTGLCNGISKDPHVCFNYLVSDCKIATSINVNITCPALCGACTTSTTSTTTTATKTSTTSTTDSTTTNTMSSATTSNPLMINPSANKSKTATAIAVAAVAITGIIALAVWVTVVRKRRRGRYQDDDMIGLTSFADEDDNDDELLDFTGGTITIADTTTTESTIDANISSSTTGAAGIASKFVAPAIRLGTAGQAAKGLPDLMGIDDAQIGMFMQEKILAIVKEFEAHGSDEDKENLRGLLNGTYRNPPDSGLVKAAGNATRMAQKTTMLDPILNQAVTDAQAAVDADAAEKAATRCVTLDELMQTKEVRTSGIERHHVLALRLYTTSSYRLINNPLRTTPPTQPHPLAATTYFISDAIKKLRTVGAEQADAFVPVVYYRGLAGMALPTAFMEQGGTEYGCMSTSAARDIAVEFAGTKHPLVFKYETENFMSRGADISFLSVYPEEKEALYPPLTYLSASKICVEVIDGVKTLVVTVKPTFPT